MKYFILVLLFFICYIANAVKLKDSPNCELLQKIFRNSTLIKHLHYKQHLDSIIIVDTFKFFKCDNLKLPIKYYEIDSIYNSKIKDGVRSYANLSYLKNKKFLVLENIKRLNKKVQRLTFWQPNDNATFIIDFYFTKQKSKMKIVSYGVY